MTPIYNVPPNDAVIEQEAATATGVSGTGDAKGNTLGRI